MSDFVKRVALHMRNGTVIERVQLRLQLIIKRVLFVLRQKNRARRLRFWYSQMDAQGKMEIEILRGVRMQLFSDSALSEGIYCGDYELAERQFLQAFLRPGDVFLDVGANIGLYTVIAANLVGTAGSVYSFEPCFKTFNRLVSNISLNQYRNVHCYQLALSSIPGKLRMNVSLERWDAWNSLVQPTSTAEGAFAVETISAIKWDDFSREHNLMGQVTMMKIDVEGWETQVLLGASEMLSQPSAPVLLIEFSETSLKNAGSSIGELQHLLEKFGYRIYAYEATSRRLISPLSQQYYGWNRIATKNPNLLLARINAHQ